MINELYTLSQAMQKYEISGRAQYRSYLPLPNVKKDAPCIQILLSKNNGNAPKYAVFLGKARISSDVRIRKTVERFLCRNYD